MNHKRSQQKKEKRLGWSSPKHIQRQEKEKKEKPEYVFTEKFYSR